MERAIDGYLHDVESGEFPADEHSHHESDLNDVY
jgi:3-methyl-2-oxobutanoate hydroxymethyltransferase